MKKNGFLSVSTVFAFFLVFLSLMLYIILNMSNNRFLLDKMKITIKSELTTEKTLADWVKDQYDNQVSGSEAIYLHDSSLVNGAGDSSYRYAGSSDSVNNFVCFGSDETICPDDNLYRIIGVFNGQVKLIKWDYAINDLLGTDGGYGTTYLDAGYDGINKGNNAVASIGGYYWNKTGTNTWSTSTLNLTNLNTNFINKVGSVWSEKIAITTWKVGGNTQANINGVLISQTYKNEYTNPAKNRTYDAQIGLMYASDYGYAASSNEWVTKLSSYSGVSSTNWMYMGLNEWIVVPQSATTNFAFFINSSGNVDSVSVSATNYAVRPVFYLNSDIIYASGTGTKIDPVRLG